MKKEEVIEFLKSYGWNVWRIEEKFISASITPPFRNFSNILDYFSILKENLIWNIDDNRTTIIEYDSENSDSEVVIFEGYVKTIDEFKALFKMLVI